VEAAEPVSCSALRIRKSADVLQQRLHREDISRDASYSQNYYIEAIKILKIFFLSILSAVSSMNYGTR
jgi:hypothetical protein